MRTIWKYPLELDALQKIEMPKGAEILSCAEQDGAIVVWAMVSPAADKQTRQFEIFWTGDGVPSLGRRRFLATVTVGRYVHHVFEKL